jgi:hypothetical protein
MVSLLLLAFVTVTSNDCHFYFLLLTVFALHLGQQPFALGADLDLRPLPVFIHLCFVSHQLVLFGERLYLGDLPVPRSCPEGSLDFDRK